MIAALGRAGGSYRAVLREPRYARLWLAGLISSFGDTLHYIALLVLVLQLSGQGLAVAGLVAIEILPVLLLAPIAGVLIDRTGRAAGSPCSAGRSSPRTEHRCSGRSRVVNAAASSTQPRRQRSRVVNAPRARRGLRPGRALRAPASEAAAQRQRSRAGFKRAKQPRSGSEAEQGSRERSSRAAAAQPSRV